MTMWEIKYNDNFAEIVDDEKYALHLHNIVRDRELIHPFIGDSRDYLVLYNAAARVAKVPGLFCEIGLRQGGGTKTIIDAALNTNPQRTVVTVDPYGSIPFEGMEGEHRHETEYSNIMQKETLEKMYRYVAEFPKINFLFFPLEDIEFFKSFTHGVPVYIDSQKNIMNQYALVHLDGPHTYEITQEETNFFIERMPIGGVIVYDDVKHFYDHDLIKDFLLDRGWTQLEETDVKASYERFK